MKLNTEELEKLNQLFENINSFSSAQIGIGTGHTTGFESVLMRLRKSALEMSKATSEGSLQVTHVDALESDLQAAVTISPAGFLSSFKSSTINPKEIDGVMVFLDSIREKISP